MAAGRGAVPGTRRCRAWVRESVGGFMATDAALIRVAGAMIALFLGQDVAQSVSKAQWRFRMGNHDLCESPRLVFL